MAQWLTNPTRNHEVAGSVPALAVSCGVGYRRGSDPTLLWLWRRPAATAPIRPLAWEPPYAAGAVQKDKIIIIIIIRPQKSSKEKEGRGRGKCFDGGKRRRSMGTEKNPVGVGSVS